MSFDYLFSLSIMLKCHNRNGTHVFCINHPAECSSFRQSIAFYGIATFTSSSYSTSLMPSFVMTLTSTPLKSIRKTSLELLGAHAHDLHALFVVDIGMVVLVEQGETVVSVSGVSIRCLELGPCRGAGSASAKTAREETYCAYPCAAYGSGA